jgi:ribosomal protein S18 acetylase RimI-like enzyme
MTKIVVHIVDYNDPLDGADLLSLLEIYAIDPMGGGGSLSDHARANLLSGLQAVPHAFSLIASMDGEPAGLANCFWGFSTFSAKPLVNIHDIVVAPEFRGRGVAKVLFAKIEEMAAAKGACKVTLEVLSLNEPAKALYKGLGYNAYTIDPAQGTALFWQKELAA